MLKLILPFILFLLSTLSLAAETIDIDVKGMVCSFCAQGIERGFKKEKQVSSIDVQLENYKVLLKTEEKNSLTDERIKQVITDAGISVVKITRK